MNTKCAFTICAKNYIGLAKILEQSFKKYNEGVDFYIIVADELDSVHLLNKNILIAKNILGLDNSLWNEVSFKYNITEFCTFIKPNCFKYFFNLSSYEKVVYLDPDILFYSSLEEEVYTKLDNYSIVITPHILNIVEEESLNFKERDFLFTGSFNLGFIGLKNDLNSINLINWWGNRLINDCFSDRLVGTYTDQKWISLLPCFFDNNTLFISRNNGLNVAPWNFSERKILINNDLFYVQDRREKTNSINRLVFVHYSGFNYKDLLNGQISRKSNTAQIKYDDLNLIFNYYKNHLINNKEIFLEYINLPYSYNYFNDKKSIIEPIHRRLYNGLLNRKIKIDNPFSIDGSFYNKLFESKMISYTLTPSYNKYNLPSAGKKIKFMKVILLFVRKIIGHKKYVHLVSSLRPFSMFENHIFLINKNFIDSNL